MLVLKDPAGAYGRRAERSAHLRSCRPAQEQDEGLGLVVVGHPCSFSTGQRAQGVTGDVPPWLGVLEMLLKMHRAALGSQWMGADGDLMYPKGGKRRSASSRAGTTARSAETPGLGDASIMQLDSTPFRND